jgi:hypothetical protein
MYQEAGYKAGCLEGKLNLTESPESPEQSET